MKLTPTVLVLHFLTSVLPWGLLATDPASIRELLPQRQASGHVTRFRTEPSFLPATINITQASDPLRLESGYIFVAPFMINASWPLQIFDQQANLVYYGGALARGRTQGVRVCDFDGQSASHLCFSDQIFREQRTVNRVVDNTYREVRHYGVIAGLGQPDAHEFNVLPGGKTYLQAVGNFQNVDLTKFNSGKSDRVRQGCFQEVDVATAQELFRWCFLDQYTVEDAHDPRPFRENPDEGKDRPTWDFVHMNAVAKNPEGDYLVSMRHVDAIFKIAGLQNRRGLAPGTTIWRLGGRRNEFKRAKGTLFFHQHDVRVLNITSDEEVISFFNNGLKTQPPSRGVIFGVNNRTMTVRLIQNYSHPAGGFSRAQGSMQVLPNKNALVGWGAQTEFSEFTEDGTLLVHGSVSEGPINYRTHKYNWTGVPTERPKLVSYSLNCHGPVVAYMSWNGATELAAWRVWADDVQVGVFNKTSFETRVDVSRRFVSKVEAEALSKKRTVLDSVVSSTFVPKRGILHECDADGCSRDDYSAWYDVAASCGASLSSLAMPFLLFVATVELTSGLAGKIMSC